MWITSNLLRSTEKQAAGWIGEGGVERRGEFLRDLVWWHCELEQGAREMAARARGNSGGACAFPFIAAGMGKGSGAGERRGAAQRPGRSNGVLCRGGD